MKLAKKMMGISLAALLLLSMSVAPARSAELPQEGDIAVAAFAPLGEDVAEQSVAQGTELSALTLPQELAAQDGEDRPLTIADVEWSAEPPYDAGAPGEYLFTAVLPQGYALQGEALLPKIAVTVQAAPAQPDIAFAFGPEGALYLDQGVAVTEQDLLLGVTAQDEAGGPVAVSVVDTGALSLADPQPPEDPAQPYIITYEAAHPVTGAAFTQERQAYVTAKAAQPDIAFTFDPEEPLRIEKGVAITEQDLLLGVTAQDETGKAVTVSVADTGELNLDDPQRPEGPVFPAIPHLITYQAEHPVTGDVYTRQREVYVTIGAVPAAIAVGAFTISLTEGGDEPTLNTDYKFENNVLTIMSGTPMTIANVEPTTPTPHRIVIDANVEANLTLAGVNIETGWASPAALDVTDAALHLTLVGDNILKSNSMVYAGLQVPAGAELTITAQNATGTLTATSGGAAGIGGSASENGGTITILDGTVNATGGDRGAGIGGGEGGSGGEIAISGGDVTATGGNNGAGIGGGYIGAGGDIAISGGTVVAKGGDGGAGIGGGQSGSGGEIAISGGTVNATGGNRGAGIGGGQSGSGGEIAISGGTVEAKGGASGAGIGGGRDGDGGKITLSGSANVTAQGGSAISSAGNVGDGGGAGLGGGGGLTGAGGNGGSGGEIAIYSGVTVQATGGTGAKALGAPGANNWPTGEIGYGGGGAAIGGGGGRATSHPSQNASAGGGVGTILTLPAGLAGLTLLSGKGAYEGSTTTMLGGQGAEIGDGGDAYIGAITSSPDPDRNGEPATGYSTNDWAFTINSMDASTPVLGTDYSYDPVGGVLTILTDTPMTIANKVPATPTTHRIVIGTSAGVTANLTLAGVNIETDADPALDVTGAALHLTLVNDNTLKASEMSFHAALHVPAGAELTITAPNLTGKLTATGGHGGAGIGGGNGGSGGTIAISGGTVNATGGDFAAGIGGGGGGSGGTIAISGGTVTATGSNNGAGIGGGMNGSGGTIAISGNADVTATGGINGAGIGGGEGGSGGEIAISGGTVNATGGYGAAGIGGGWGGSGGKITLSGSANVTAQGGSGGSAGNVGGGGGAGLGGGGNDDGNGGSGGEIAIHSGVTVKATGGNGARAIDTGPMGEWTTDHSGYGGGGAAIGGGGGRASAPSNASVGSGVGTILTLPADRPGWVLTPGKGAYEGGTMLGGQGAEIGDGGDAYIGLITSTSGGANGAPATSQSISVGDFTISLTEGGGLPQPDTDYSYSGGVLTIKSGTPMTIANTNPGVATTHRIVIGTSAGVTANLTLAGVNINTGTGPALDVTGAKLNLTLVNDNTLKTTHTNSAGLQVPAGAELLITSLSTGKLTATGGYSGAGIGGGMNGSGGDIAISGGTVNATGGNRGAGIGGGVGGSGGEIAISGGTVTVTGGNSGAGIGGGGGGSGGAITISGGTVTATGGNNGAGIGGGNNGSSGTIAISGGTVNAIGDDGGAGIGGGMNGSGGTIAISGGTVEAKGGASGAGIGGGRGGDGGKITLSGSADVTAQGGSATRSAANVGLGGGAGLGGGGGSAGDGGNGGEIAIYSGVTVQATGGAGAKAFEEGTPGGWTPAHSGYGGGGAAIGGGGGRATSHPSQNASAGGGVGTIVTLPAGLAGLTLVPGEGGKEDPPGTMLGGQGAKIGSGGDAFIGAITSSSDPTRNGKEATGYPTNGPAPSGPHTSYDRTYRTLTDPYTGVSVYGYFNQGAWLWVGSSAHAAGTCYACDQIRAYQAAGQVIALHDIAVYGGYQGDVRVSIPVGSWRDGQQVHILHCSGGLLEARTTIVSGGSAQGVFSGLSPFAVVQSPATGLPGSYSLYTGGRVSWMPLSPGGTWSYDSNYLFLAQQGDWYTFHALRAGYTAATYTVNGVSHTVYISIGQSMLPQTGQAPSPLPPVLMALAILCGALAVRRRARG